MPEKSKWTVTRYPFCILQHVFPIVRRNIKLAQRQLPDAAMSFTVLVQLVLFTNEYQKSLACVHSGFRRGVSRTSFFWDVTQLRLLVRCRRFGSSLSVPSSSSGVPRNFVRGEGDSTNSVEDRGQRERGSGGGSPLFRGSGGSCNLVQEILFYIVKFS